MAYAVKNLRLVFGVDLQGNRTIGAEGCVCDPTGSALDRFGRQTAASVDYSGDSFAEAEVEAEAALKKAAGV